MLRNEHINIFTTSPISKDRLTAPISETKKRKKFSVCTQFNIIKQHTWLQ